MLPRSWIVFGGILALGGMLSFVFPSFWNHPAILIGVVLLAVVGGLASRASTVTGGAGKNLLPSRGEFLCDTCKYDHPDLCSHAERPNATRCSDYKSRL
jgi:hypothetical protein